MDIKHRVKYTRPYLQTSQCILKFEFHKLYTILVFSQFSFLSFFHFLPKFPLLFYSCLLLGFPAFPLSSLFTISVPSCLPAVFHLDFQHLPYPLFSHLRQQRVVVASNSNLQILPQSSLSRRNKPSLVAT